MLFTHFRRKSDSTTETESEISSDSSQSLEEQTEENNVLDSESREVITKLLDDKEIENLESVEHRVFNIKESNLVDQDGDLDPHLCSECLTGPAILRCVECQDAFCFTCFKMIHRSGNRQFHKTESMDNDGDLSTSTVPGNFCSSLPPSVNAISSKNECSDLLIQRSKYIPLRLTLLERKKMRLVEATLHVSEYTDRMDVAKFIDKKNRTLQQLREICAILTGVLISLDYEEGQLLMDNREFCKYEKIYQELFEIPRRYKILNPERMRSSYGKLMYFLQDTCVSEIQNLLQLNCIRPMRTVYSLLAERGKLALLKDSTVETATKVITSAGKSRSEVQRDIKKKNAAVAYLARTYSSSSLSKEEIERCLHSINDNNTFLYANRDPCEKMIGYLKKYFKPDSFEPGYSLVITAGADGARLSHSHTRQYYYCLQSLTLWREILHNFYQLWFCTEKDLLSNSNSYELKDTGQGRFNINKNYKLFFNKLFF
ncbi:UPF0652 protein-like [Zophobas morio]|uniref:UPF0652 protein-like n=1 Tax=Zophobas morio TaxID=2755281 RepID=UPI00308387D7